MACRIRQPVSPGSLRPESRQHRSRERCRAVAAKLRAARHLPADAADVAQRSIQVIHTDFTLQCKVSRENKFVKMPDQLPEGRWLTWRKPSWVNHG